MLTILLFLISAVVVASGMVLLIECDIEDLWLGAIVIIMGAFLCFMASNVSSASNETSFREQERVDCVAAGGSYIIVTAGTQPDICVTSENVILNPGWNKHL